MATKDAKPQKSTLEQLIAQGKKPEDLTEAEKKAILDEVDREVEKMTADDVIKAVERGEIEIEYVDPPNPIDNFTEENFKKFLFGKITWAQLEGMTMELYKQLAPFITVYGMDGRIGPLSAPDEVLSSIPNITRNDIDRLRSSMGTPKETERAIQDLSRHVGAYLVDEPGPAYVVSVGVRRSDDKFASGKVYVVATGIDAEAPYRLISKRPLGSAQLSKAR